MSKEKYYSNPGSRYSYLYSSSLDDHQRITLKKSGKRDNVAFINSFRDMTDIQFIVKRLNSGDLSVLNARNPFYADITRAPTTRADMMQLQIDAENSFYALPPDVRHQFNDNFREYLADAGSQEWLKKLGVYSTAAQNPGPGKDGDLEDA